MTIMIQDIFLIKNLFCTILLNKKIPISVNYAITYKCNQNCDYCGIYEKNSLKKSDFESEMNSSQIFSMIDQLKNMGMVRLGITGGESLLREDLGDVIRYSKNKGVMTTLVSNGYLVPKKIKGISDLDILFLSLDGKEFFNDKHRGKGSFKKVVKALQVAKKYGIRTVILSSLKKGSDNNIDFLVDFAEKNNTYVAFQILSYPHLTTKQRNGLIPSKEEHKNIIKRIIETKKKSKVIINSSASLNYLLNEWPEHKNLKCWGGRAFCTIDPWGYVFPCYIKQKIDGPLNGIEVGFKKAFENIPKFECDRCNCYSHIENNLMLSLNLDSIFAAKHFLDLKNKLL